MKEEPFFERAKLKYSSNLKKEDKITKIIICSLKSPPIFGNE